MATTNNGYLSEETGHKYTFQLELKKLYVNPSFPFDVKIVWARNQQRIQSQNPIKLQPPDNELTLHECFCNKSTVLYNKKNRQFRKKQSKIQIILYANGSPKQGGQFNLNLCQILDPFDIKKSQQKIYRVTTRQQKPHCQIQFKLTAQYYQEMIRDEQRSVGSGVGSISSKNTTSLSNMNMPVSDSKNYVEKKNLFLYQAPSKDNQSVTSYTSYGTGMMRYTGSNKKQRNDSTSVKKDEYVVPKRQSVDMFNKTTNMKSNISQQYDLKSKNGGTYNRYSQQNFDKFDNKTQNFDNNSNKQLVEEQQKRSKLQAEVSRLNIYMKQQSSKLTQYITENTLLKQQLHRLNSEHQSTKPTLQSLRHQYEEMLDKAKKQNNDLQNRVFDLNNQNRELHRYKQNISIQKQRVEDELRRIKYDKERNEGSLKNIESMKQNLNRELQKMNDQLEHIKGLNSNLKENLEKQKRKNQQIQHNKQYSLNSIEENNKKKDLRILDLQKENNILRNQLYDRENQIEHKKDILYRLEKTNQQYKTKILFNQNEKSGFFEQNKSLRHEYERIRQEVAHLTETNSRIRDQKTAEFKQKSIQLQNQNYQYQQKIRSLQYQNEQNKKGYTQILTLNETIKKQLDEKKNEIFRLETNLKSLRQFENRFYSLDKLLGEKEREIQYTKQENIKLSYRSNQLEELMRRMTIELQDTKKKVKQNSHPDVDVNEILRESVQMQVQLKFKTDQLVRLKNIEQQYEDIKYRVEIQQKNKHQLQLQVQRIQKQLKDKNKMYLIEIEKGKLMIRQKSQIQRQLQGQKGQLKKCQQIIYNGDRQVRQMSDHIQYIENENKSLNPRIQSLQRELNETRIRANDTSRFEMRIKQLQRQIQQKQNNINLLSSNISISHRQIEQLKSEINDSKRMNQSTSEKLINLQQTRNHQSNQLQRIITQKKSIQLKNEMIMSELHNLKKNFEEQKGRSTSIVSIRSTEDQVRIRALQNEVEKKDKIISKLTKQKLEMEEQNINLHVQVMKKLSQMQKNKQS